MPGYISTENLVLETFMNSRRKHLEHGMKEFLEVKDEFVSGLNEAIFNGVDFYFDFSKHKQSTKTRIENFLTDLGIKFIDITPNQRDNDSQIVIRMRELNKYLDDLESKIPKEKI